MPKLQVDCRKPQLAVNDPVNDSFHKVSLSHPTSDSVIALLRQEQLKRDLEYRTLKP